MRALTEALRKDIARKANRRPSGLSHLRYFMVRELEYMLRSDLLTDVGRANIQLELKSR